MSDNDNNIPKTQPLKTQPLKKTSAVPLRKETVRVTLKATPGGVKDGPPMPSAAPAPAPPTSPAPAPAPSASPMAPPSSDAPAFPDGSEKSKDVDLPDVTTAVPLKAETMRVTLKAENKTPPTDSLGAPPTGPKLAATAPTIPLSGGSASPATVPLATQPLNNQGGSSQPLPQATVQLQQTQPLTQPLGAAQAGAQAPTIQTFQDDDSSRGGDKFAGGLAVAAFFAALIVLGVQLNHMIKWVDDKGLDLVGELFK